MEREREKNSIETELNWKCEKEEVEYDTEIKNNKTTTQKRKLMSNLSENHLLKDFRGNPRAIRQF